MTRAGRFDLIHIHEVWHYPGYVRLFVPPSKHKLPCVLTIHGELSEWGLQAESTEESAYTCSSCWTGYCGMSTRYMPSLVPRKNRSSSWATKPRWLLLQTGFNLHQFEALPDPAGFIQRFPALKGKRVILFLGRLHPKKGLDILAQSFSTIARRFEDAVLLVVGPNKFGTREKMESILGSEDLLGRTVFTGLLTGEDKLAAMNCADLFVLPSHSDVLGIAVLEAMAARLPVVITEGCEFPEVSEHGAGFVVEADEAPIAEAMTMLLSDADLRKRMGQQGRKLVTERYTWQATAATMANLYKTLVAGDVCHGVTVN